MGSSCLDVAHGMCGSADCPTLACLGRARARCGSTSAGRRAEGRLGGGPRLPDPGRGRKGRPGRGGLARHLRAPRRRGAARRVAPARLARPPRLGLLARAEHAARHDARLRGGDPARRALAGAARDDRLGRRGRERRDRPRPAPALPRRDAELPPPLERQGLARQRGGPRAHPRLGRAPRRADGPDARRGDRGGARARRPRASGSTRRGCSTSSSTSSSTPSRRARKGGHVGSASRTATRSASASPTTAAASRPRTSRGSSSRSSASARGGPASASSSRSTSSAAGAAGSRSRAPRGRRRRSS